MKTEVNINGQKVEITLTEDQIKQLQSATDKPKRWRAERRNVYWMIDDMGDADDRVDVGNKYDDFRYKTRNYFKTKEEAQAHLEKINLIAEIRDRIEELNDGWTPDWNNGNEDKHSIYYGQPEREFFTDVQWRSQCLENWKYLKSEEDTETLIKEFGDKLKVLFE